MCPDRGDNEKLMDVNVGKLDTRQQGENHRCHGHKRPIRKRIG